MTPEEKQQLNSLQVSVRDLNIKFDRFLDVYNRTNFIDKQVYKHPSYFKKVAFFGSETLVDKQVAITAPSGGTTIDTQARTTIGTIITTLQNLGLTL